MRFRLEHPDRAPYWLIGNPALNERTQASDALSADIQIARNQQELTGVNFDYRQFFDRQNQKVSFTAETYRVFVDEWERMDFLARLAPTNIADEEHKWEGTVWLRIDGEGDTYREWQLPGAVIALDAVKPEGAVGLRMRYRINAGGFGGAASTQTVNLIAYSTAPAAPTLILNGATLDAAYGAVWQGIQGQMIVQWRKAPYEAYNFTAKYFDIVPPGYYSLAGTPGTIGIPLSDFFGQIAGELNAEDEEFTATASGGNLTLTNNIAAGGSDNYVKVTLNVMQYPGPDWNAAARLTYRAEGTDGRALVNLISGTNNLVATQSL